MQREFVYEYKLGNMIGGKASMLNGPADVKKVEWKSSHNTHQSRRLDEERG